MTRILLSSVVATALAVAVEYESLDVRYRVLPNGRIIEEREGRLPFDEQARAAFSHLSFPLRGPGAPQVVRFRIAGEAAAAGRGAAGYWSVPLGKIQEGDIIDYLVRQAFPAPSAGGHSWFEDPAWFDAPAAAAGALTLELPSGGRWRVQVLDRRGYSTSRKAVVDVHTWTFAGSLLPNRAPRFRISTFASREELGRWASARNAPESTAEIRALAESLKTPAAIYQFVSARLGLVDTPPAESAWQGAPAVTVLAAKEGTPLDKQRLFCSLVRLAGTPCELAFEWNDSAETHPSVLARPLAVVGSERIWVDPADSAAPFGALRADLRGRAALLLTTPPAVVSIPAVPSAAARSTVTARLSGKLLPTGVLEAMVTYSARGEAVRAWRSAAEPGRGKELAELISAEVEKMRIRGEPRRDWPDDDSEFTLTMPVEQELLSPVAARASAAIRLLRSRADVAGEQQETIDIDLGTGFSADAEWATREQDAQSRYESSARIEGTRLRVNRRLVVEAQAGGPVMTVAREDGGRSFEFRRIAAIDVDAVIRATEPHKLSPLAYQVWRDGDLPGARKLLEAAVAAQPDNEASHALLGSVLTALGQRQEARRALERAVELNPASGALTQLALMDAQDHDWKNGIRWLQQKIKASPNDKLALGLMPTALLHVGRYGEVEAATQAARPNSRPDVVVMVARTCLGQPEAEEELRFHLAGLKSGPHAASLAAGTLAECGKLLDYAEEVANVAYEHLLANAAFGPFDTHFEASQSRGGLAKTLEAKAWLLYRKGDSEGAANLYQAVMQLTPNPTSALRLGLSLDKSGKRTEALGWFRLAMELGPSMRANIPADALPAAEQAPLPTLPRGWRVLDVKGTESLTIDSGSAIVFVKAGGPVDRVKLLGTEVARLRPLVAMLESAVFPDVTVLGTPIPALYVVRAVRRNGAVQIEYHGGIDGYVHGTSVDPKQFTPPVRPVPGR